MTSYKHKTLLEKISHLNREPSDHTSFEKWIAAEDHLDFLHSNSQDDELILYAAVGNAFFVHGVAMKRDLLSTLDKSDLVGWQGNPYGSRAGYNFGQHDSCVWISEAVLLHGSKSIENAQQLVFMRTLEGLPEDSTYCEILQELSHLSETHWRDEQSSYCCFDENGDSDRVVSVTIGTGLDEATLVSMQREPLELYLAASDSILVQMFDFICTQRGKFDGWSNEPERLFFERDDLFYRQKIDSNKAGYTRGIQVVPMRRPRADIFSSYHTRLFGRPEREYVKFVAYDWRNKQEAEISTDPAATTNYFEAHENSLPFEMSPAFFRPEVLSKYKSDRDKYVYDEVNRTMSCRDQWTLKSIDVNEAGQVHAYICDLRMLPYQEQLYWKSFNEPGKTGISKRTFETDFEGSWDSDTDSLHDIRLILEEWRCNRVPWWKLNGERLINQITVPRTESRGEWGRSFMYLSQLIIEGLVSKAIRGKLDAADISYEKRDKSIALLEKFLVTNSRLEPGERLDGLREVHDLRNKYAHVQGSEFDKMSKEALKTHGSYSNHFLDVCKTVCCELNLIEEAFGPQKLFSNDNPKRNSGS